MLSRVNSFGSLTVMVIALMLLACFAGSIVYADGGGGQIPNPPPPQPAPPGGGDDGTTLTDVVGTLLYFIV
jgi:hypothetical protein